MPTKAARFAQNSRDAPPSRVKAENYNNVGILEVEYNYQEQPVDSTIKQGLEISSLNLLFGNPAQENKPEIDYVKPCNFCNHTPTLRDFITH